mgnify:CR=1 FL=1
MRWIQYILDMEIQWYSKLPTQNVSKIDLLMRYVGKNSVANEITVELGINVIQGIQETSL